MADSTTFDTGISSVSRLYEQSTARQLPAYKSSLKVPGTSIPNHTLIELDFNKTLQRLERDFATSVLSEQIIYTPEEHQELMQKAIAMLLNQIADHPESDRSKLEPAASLLTAAQEVYEELSAQRKILIAS